MDELKFNPRHGPSRAYSEDRKASASQGIAE